MDLSDASSEILKALSGGATRQSFIAAIQPEDMKEIFIIISEEV